MVDVSPEPGLQALDVAGRKLCACSMLIPLHLRSMGADTGSKCFCLACRDWIVI